MLDGKTKAVTDGAEANLIEIEIVYAKPDEQVLLCLKLPEGSTINDALVASGLLDRFPEIDLSVNKVGIFGSVGKTDQVLKRNDRVEIYRSLLHDPKESRRQRAVKK